MPQGYQAKTGIPCCSLPQVVEAKIKGHKDKLNPSSKVAKAIRYMREAMQYDVTFEKGTVDSTIDPADLYTAFLNLARDEIVDKLERGEYLSSLSRVFYRIDTYLPEEARVVRRNLNDNEPHSAEFMEMVKDFMDEVVDACMRLEDYLTRNYVVEGRNNQLEVLKRRFKNNWTDQQKQNAPEKVAESTLNVVIKDA